MPFSGRAGAHAALGHQKTIPPARSAPAAGYPASTAVIAQATNMAADEAHPPRFDCSSNVAKSSAQLAAFGMPTSRFTSSKSAARVIPHVELLPRLLLDPGFGSILEDKAVADRPILAVEVAVPEDLPEHLLATDVLCCAGFGD